MISSPSSCIPPSILSLAVTQYHNAGKNGLLPINDKLNLLFEKLPKELANEINKYEFEQGDLIVSEHIHFAAKNVILNALISLGDIINLSLKHWVMETTRRGDCCGSHNCYSAKNGTIPRQLKNRFDTLMLCTKTTQAYQVLSKNSPLSYNDQHKNLKLGGLGKLFLEEKHLREIDPVFVQTIMLYIIPKEVWDKTLSIVSESNSRLGIETINFIINDMVNLEKLTKDPFKQEVEFLQMQIENLLNSKKDETNKS